VQTAIGPPPECERHIGALRGLRTPLPSADARALLSADTRALLSADARALLSTPVPAGCPSARSPSLRGPRAGDGIRSASASTRTGPGRKGGVRLIDNWPPLFASLTPGALPTTSTTRRSLRSSSVAARPVSRRGRRLLSRRRDALQRRERPRPAAPKPPLDERQSDLCVRGLRSRPRDTRHHRQRNHREQAHRSRPAWPTQASSIESCSWATASTGPTTSRRITSSSSRSSAPMIGRHAPCRA